jgi:uncharacterized protein YjdB
MQMRNHSRWHLGLLLITLLILAACSDAANETTNQSNQSSGSTVLTGNQVAQANMPRAQAPFTGIVAPIPDQVIQVETAITVAVQIQGPAGARPFIADVRSGSNDIATAAIDGQGGVTLRGVAVGNVTVRVVVDDGTGNRATTVFRVTVTDAPVTPNQPPILDPVPNQSVAVDGRIDVPLRMFDPEGFFPFITEAASAASAIATADSNNEGGVVVYGFSPGQTQITVTISDGQGGQATTTFTVTVGDFQPAPTETPNANPVLVTPLSDQVVAVGQDLTIPIRAQDPEGFHTFIYGVTSSASSIAIVSNDNESNLIIRGVSPGQATIEVTISDGRAGYTDVAFTVTVGGDAAAGANQPPLLETPGEQLLAVGQELILPIEASDPEGTRPFIASVESSLESIVTGEADGEGNVRLVGIAPGTAVITVRIEDGAGVQNTVAFAARVQAPEASAPNEPPVVEPVPDQLLEINHQVTVPVTMSDPEGFQPFFVDVRSASDQIATAELDGEGGIIVTAVSPGQVTISFTVDDGNGGTASSSFQVRVPPLPTATPNIPPMVQPILDQSVNAGQTITVFISASDPEGFFPFIGSFSSAAATIATAEPDGEGNLLVTGVSPGQTTITVTLDDGNGGTATADFNVTVLAVATAVPNGNLPPEFEGVPNQTVAVDTFLPVPVGVTDPEGEAVTLTVLSSSDAIAPVQVSPEGEVVVYGAAPGTATITVTATDESGRVASLVFLVTVGGFTDLPAIPNAADLTSLGAIREAANLEPTLERFVVAGNVPVSELVDAESAPEDLQAVAAFVESQPEEGTDTAVNPDWRLADLLNPANNPEGCEAANPLTCSAQASGAAVVFLMVGQADVAAATPLADFEASLRQAVNELVTLGSIPVLVTIPGEGVESYNAIIAQVAAEQGLPLWNLAVLPPDATAERSSQFLQVLQVLQSTLQ